MSSSIFFRFKSRKDALQINFDGTSLSVFEVKREIMNISRMGDGKDFDLEIYTPDTMDIYNDDTTQIPRSTTVIARRLPASKPGAGRAARYVTGQMPVHARNRIEPKSTSSTAIGNGAAMTEEERMNAMFDQSKDQMRADVQNSAGRPVHKTTHKSAAVPDKPLPPGYMCHRCGKGGHWIQACPTNNDPNFERGHKFKRTTGIPKSFHVAIDVEHAIGEDGQVDPTKLGKGAMYTQDGKWVKTKTDEVAWQKLQDQQKAAAEKAKEAESGSQELRDRGLECSIDNRPFANPHQTPCCGKTYCFDCIERTVLESSDLACPNCGEQVILDDLQPDAETAKQLADFEAEKKTDKQRKDKESSQSPAADTPELTIAKSPSAAPDAKANGGDSPSSTKSDSKKRKADDELENKRRPSNPAEMKKTASTQGTPQPPIGPASQSVTQPPKGPKAMVEKNVQEQFSQQMSNMFGSMPGAQNGMNAFANPMMMNPMMGPMGMGMPGMPMGNMPFNPMIMGPMRGMNMGMGMGMGMNGMNGMNSGMNGNMGGFQNQQPGWMRNGGVPNGPPAASDSAYMRQPVNPHRHQGRQRRQRSVDYKQM